MVAFLDEWSCLEWHCTPVDSGMQQAGSAERREGAEQTAVAARHSLQYTDDMKHTKTIRRQKSEPAYSRRGVDLTLIRDMLALTPAERLQVLQSSVQSLWSMLNGNIPEAGLPRDSRCSEQTSR
jgi:hypothetical protein